MDELTKDEVFHHWVPFSDDCIKSHTQNEYNYVKFKNKIKFKKKLKKKKRSHSKKKKK